MKPSLYALCIFLFVMGVWFAPGTAVEQLEQRVKVVVVVTVAVVFFAAGYTVGRYGGS